MTTENNSTETQGAAQDLTSDAGQVSALASLFDEPTETSEQEQVEAGDVEEHDNVDSDTTDDSESATETDDDEDETTADNDDEETDSDADSAPEFDEQEFEIMVDGEPLTVKGSELKSGYMRQSAFTKKTQELATERKQLEAEKAGVVQQANIVKFQAHTKLGQFNDALKQAGGWEKLRATYPPEQVEQFTQMYVNAQQEAQVADGIISEFTAQTKQQNVKAIEGIFKDMAQTYDGFSGETIAQMDKYLSANGFDEDMILSVTHPAAWDMILKAMKYDQAQARQKTKQTTSAKETKPAKQHNAPVKKTSQQEGKRRQVDKAIQKQKQAIGNKTAEQQSTVDALALILGS